MASQQTYRTLNLAREYANQFAGELAIVLFDMEAHVYEVHHAQEYGTLCASICARVRAKPAMHEVVDATTWHKLVVDVDVDGGMSAVDFLAMVERVANVARDVVASMFFVSLMPDDVRVYDSIYLGEARMGAHIVIQRAVENFNVARAFADVVIAALSASDAKYIDRGFYVRTHNLRILGCSKAGSKRVKKLRATASADADTFVREMGRSLVGGPCAHIECSVAPLRDDASPSDACVSADADLVTSVCALIEAKYPCAFRLRRATAFADGSTTILFNRLARAYCAICERVHENDSSVFVVARAGACNASIMEYCWRDTRSPRKGILLQTTNPQLEQALASQGDTAPTQRSDQYSTIVYDEPCMRPLAGTLSDVDTLYIRAPMKIGKTKALRDAIDELYGRGSQVSAISLDCDCDCDCDEPAPVQQGRAPHIVFVSFRQTFAREIARRFGVRLYSECAGDLIEDRMVVQVESLYRIAPDRYKYCDLLVLDESESIIEQFDSGLSRNMSANYAVFEWLARVAKKCVVMDAFLGDRTLAVLQHIRPSQAQAQARSATLIHNTHQNARDYTYRMTSNRGDWLMMLNANILAHRNGEEPIVVCVNSLQEARTLEALVRKSLNGYNRTIKLYCSDTPRRVRQADFEDVNSSWRDCDVLIYTPTITAGVSFEQIHFSRMFCYFTDKSCTAQTCMQMMGRIRNLSCKEYVVFIASQRGMFPVTRTDLVKQLRIRKGALHGIDFAYDETGLPTLAQTGLTEMRVQNMLERNKSRNNFIAQFVRFVRETGAAVRKLTTQDLEESAEVIKREAIMLAGETAREAVLREHGCAQASMSAERARAIASARDISQEEYDALRMGMNTTCDDMMALRRYELRTTYDVEEITPAFAETFDDKSLAEKYKNLRELCDARDLSELRERELERTAKCAHELDGRSVYEVHRLAQAAAECMGFATPLDMVPHPIAQLTTACARNIERAARLLPQWCANYKLHCDAVNCVNDVQSVCSDVLCEAYGVYLATTNAFCRLTTIDEFELANASASASDRRIKLRPHDE